MYHTRYYLINLSPLLKAVYSMNHFSLCSKDVTSNNYVQLMFFFQKDFHPTERQKMRV